MFGALALSSFAGVGEGDVVRVSGGRADPVDGKYNATHFQASMQLFVSKGTVTKLTGAEYAAWEEESFLSRINTASLGEMKGGRSYVLAGRIVAEPMALSNGRRMFVMANGEYEVKVIGSNSILSRMLDGVGPVMVGKGVVLVFANAYLNIATGDVDVYANSDTKCLVVEHEDLVEIAGAPSQRVKVSPFQGKALSPVSPPSQLLITY